MCTECTHEIIFTCHPWHTYGLFACMNAQDEKFCSVMARFVPEDLSSFMHQCPKHALTWHALNKKIYMHIPFGRRNRESAIWLKGTGRPQRSPGWIDPWKHAYCMQAFQFIHACHCMHHMSCIIFVACILVFHGSSVLLTFIHAWPAGLHRHVRG